MKETLNVALIQADLVWEKAEVNRQNLRTVFNALPKKTDLIVLPEMFPTGFSMHPEKIAETMNGETIKWLKEQADHFQTAICGSMIIKDHGKFYNRFLMVFEDGAISTYNKRHTFTLSGEDKIYERGYEKVIVDLKGWKICPMVCYDLRFPVWSRNVEDYDLLIYVANWPVERIDAWDALLKARAIENMSYCVGVNRIGEDGNGYKFNGHSAAFNGLGNRLAEFEEDEAGYKQVEMNRDHLTEIRESLMFLQDRDEFNLEV
ncbi:MAG: amidohydrolase [Flavobacteriaceae bacterium]|nr:amidohydrolase [Bacteroidia bacterium]NNK88088.1 amidohydrolase [Flavobacteriaceae bacterium]